jgi:hypothetical protein
VQVLGNKQLPFYLCFVIRSRILKLYLFSASRATKEIIELKKVDVKKIMEDIIEHVKGADLGPLK